ncbi:MAG: hypothetical protein QW776_06755 [Candidatus Nitrosocaldus sp.]
MEAYDVIFNDSYNFEEASKTFERVLLRVDKLAFIFEVEERIRNILLTDNINIFTSIRHITFQETKPTIKRYKYYANLKYKKHFAIPFTITLEPSQIYNFVDSNCLVVINAKYKQSNYAINKYWKKHEKARSSTFYAYNNMMLAKLQARHFMTKIIVASNEKESIKRVLQAFRDFKIGKIKDKLDISLKRLFDKPNILSHVELLSLLLPSEVNTNVTVDGIRPYTSGKII